MIEIRVNDISMDLRPDTRIEIQLVNPIFAFELGFGSHSYSFALPNTGKNRRALGFLDHLNIEQSSAQLRAELRLGGGLKIMRGFLEVLSAGPSRDFEASFTLEEGAILSELRDISLQELNLGGERRLSSNDQASGVWRISQDIVGGIASVYVNGKEYQTTWGAGQAEQTVLQALASAINADPDSGCNASVSGTGATAELTIEADGLGPDFPFYATTDAPECVLNEQIWLRQSYTSSFEIAQNLLLAHGLSIIQDPVGAWDYMFFPVKNPELYGGQNSEFLGYINLYDPLSGFIGNSSGAGSSFRVSFIPFPSLRYVIKQTFAALGLEDVSSFTDSGEFKKLHLWNNKTLDLIGIDDDGSPSASGSVNWSRHYWNLSEHLPQELKPADLLSAVCRAFNLAVFVDQGSREIELFEKYQAFIYEQDWREKTLEGYYISYQKERLGNYSHEQDPDDDLSDEGWSFPAIRQDKQGKELKLEIPPIFEIREQDPTNGDFWRIPYIKQAGEIEGFEVSPDNYSPRLILFQGLQYTSNFDLYPQAGSGDLDANGASLTGPSLRWEGAQGLFSQYHQDFEEMISNGKKINGAFRLSLKDLLSLDWKKMVRFRLQEGEGRGALIKLSFSVSMQGLSDAQAQFYAI